MLQRKDQSIHKLTSELNDTRADKDQLEKLFDGSQLYIFSALDAVSIKY